MFYGHTEEKAEKNSLKNKTKRLLSNKANRHEKTATAASQNVRH